MIENDDKSTNIQDTKLLYLNDTYIYEGQSKILSSGTDSKGNYLILDETLFYPQGGGQPSDTGSLEINGKLLSVFFASFVNGKIYHYVKENLENVNIGDTCRMLINQECRIRNAKSHTSGHLLANIVETLAPELIGIKGYHFPEGPYVEFKGKLTSLSTTELIEQVVKIAKEKIETKTNITTTEVDPETLQGKIEYHLPAGKKARVVQIDGFEAVPCGGTHLKNLSDLKELTIRKVQSPKENTKISYSFA